MVVLEKLTLEEKFEFFQNKKMTSNKYFTFDRVIDNENIVIVTMNIAYFKKNDSFVMFVDNDKIIYLKDWQLYPVQNYRADLMNNVWAVKLNRHYFKVYTLKKESEDFYFKKQDTFNSLYKLAVEQQKENMPFAKRKLY